MSDKVVEGKHSPTPNLPGENGSGNGKGKSNITPTNEHLPEDDHRYCFPARPQCEKCTIVSDKGALKTAISELRNLSRALKAWVRFSARQEGKEMGEYEEYGEFEDEEMLGLSDEQVEAMEGAEVRERLETADAEKEYMLGECKRVKKSVLGFLLGEESEDEEEDEDED